MLQNNRAGKQVTVGRFLQNCGYPFQSNVYFRAERLKLLTIRSVSFRRKTQKMGSEEVAKSRNVH
uniref:Uncharacterized protein n=1 Tax=Romanomermis culicivorax TaxID=13658 RepID=A0A915JU67_ROMCU